MLWIFALGRLLLSGPSPFLPRDDPATGEGELKKRNVHDV
jgi:hypothetical protein